MLTPPIRIDIVPPGYAAGAPLPWWGKLSIKIALGALPLSRALLRHVGINRHTFVHASPDRLVSEPRSYAKRFQALAGRRPRALLELGPGRLVTRAPVYAALVDGPVWFYDIEDDAPHSTSPYAEAAALARAAGLASPSIPSGGGKAAGLRACRAVHLVGRTEALAAIPSGSVDLVISDVALEHVRRNTIPTLLRELRRISAPGALHLHSIDFHDHIGGGLNHLRFPAWFWEGRLVASSGIYVNRLGLTALLQAFAEVGFDAAARRNLAWAKPPLDAADVHVTARRLRDDDSVCHAVIEARCPAMLATRVRH